MVASDCSTTVLVSTDRGVASIGMRAPSHLHTADKYRTKRQQPVVNC